jgi:hypothetical protein
MIKPGDRVRHSYHGEGVVKSLPNNSIAWVHFDNDPENHERGCYFNTLERIDMRTDQELENKQGAVGGLTNDMIIKHETLLDQAKKSIKKDDDKLEKNRMRGAGGAPTRATTLPDDPVARKNFPVASGVLDYFPDALVAISEVSKKGNDQHNPGLPLRWTRAKSTDEADTCFRHFLQRGTIDNDGVRHTAKAAWRLLALLQKEIEASQDNK